MRPAKPWFRATEDRWYATVHGKKVSLGVKGKANRKSANAAWHRLCLEPPPPIAPVEVAKPLTVKRMVDDYLVHAKEKVKANSLAVLRGRLLPFGKAFGKTDPNAITVKQVETYMATKPWAASSRNGFVAALKACFHWATETGVIPVNPIAKLEKPAGESRGAKALISLKDHQALLAKASKPLKALLQLLWETGARPSELASLRIGDVDFAQRIAIIKDHKNAHQGKPRTLFLTDKAVGLLLEASGERETGFILRTIHGNRWAKNAISTAVNRVSRQAGAKATAYGYRHSYATRALSNGIPDATVAGLLGHSGTTMLHRHYSHLTANARHMLEAAAKVG